MLKYKDKEDSMMLFTTHGTDDVPVRLLGQRNVGKISINEFKIRVCVFRYHSRNRMPSPLVVHVPENCVLIKIGDFALTIIGH